MDVIALIGVFTPNSTQISQAEAFENLGYRVLRLDYRKAMKKGTDKGCKHLLKSLDEHKPILTIICKGLNIPTKYIAEMNKRSICCYWYMDPIGSGGFGGYIEEWVRGCHFSAFDKLNGVTAAKAMTDHVHWVCEGFDHRVDRPVDMKPSLDVGFIGSLSGGRKKYLHAIDYPVHAFSSVSRVEHATVVNSFKISLNLCSSACASDRVYKTLASGGFMLTNDWTGRELTGLVDGKHLAIANSPGEAKEKILYYLDNEEERNNITLAGTKAVQPLSRTNWAIRLLECRQEYKESVE